MDQNELMMQINMVIDEIRRTKCKERKLDLIITRDKLLDELFPDWDCEVEDYPNIVGGKL